MRGILKKNAGLARKKKVGAWLAIDDKKKNILASLCLASRLAENRLQKLETRERVFGEVMSVLMYVCLFVCGISV